MTELQAFTAPEWWPPPAARPRGIRNHNPLNIRESTSDATLWRGERTGDDDPAFEEFTHPAWGLRAGVVILRTYQRRGLRSVQAMIGRWAPPVENHTDAYVDAVARAVGVGPSVPLDLTPATLPPLLRAMVRVECGRPAPNRDWYPDRLFADAVALAETSPT